jgi:plasmid stabilization system protein ParE
MDRRIVFSPKAALDAVEAYSWYEARELGLGEEFLRSVEACLEGVRRHPQLYRVAVDDFRRAVVRRFPYEVFYEATGKTVYVYAVFHSAQDPTKWRVRLESENHDE